MSRVLTVIGRAARRSASDRVLTYSAALAFYTALALPPLLLVLLWCLGMISPGAEEFLRTEATGLFGPQTGSLVDSVLSDETRRIELRGLSGFVGALALLFAASGVFARLQAALNRIWQVKSRPGRGVQAWLRKRILSLGLLGVVAFLMLVSLAASTVISALGLSAGESVVAQCLNLAVSLALFTVLFAAAFKLLPDVELRWHDVWGGALTTAVLFALGKWVIGQYLAQRALGDQYGAASSAIVVLIWVYFNASLVLIGAELTHAWLEVAGREPHPSRYAVRLEHDRAEPAD